MVNDPQPEPLVQVPHVITAPLAKTILLVLTLQEIVEIPLLRESVIVHPPPIPLKLIGLASTRPLVVIVLPVVIAGKLILPVKVLKTPVAIYKEPRILRLKIPAIVSAPLAGFPMVKSKAFEDAVNVTVYADALEAESNITLSVINAGTEAPPAPPEVALQCVVVEASQFPVPPTQYLSAAKAEVIVPMPINKVNINVNNNFFSKCFIYFIPMNE
jgi:hypothetical protein